MTIKRRYLKFLRRAKRERGEKFAKFIFPVIRSMDVTMSLSTLFNVQTLPGPSSQVHYADYQRTTAPDA